MEKICECDRSGRCTESICKRSTRYWFVSERVSFSGTGADADRRRTLAINQALCFFIPTIAAYTVDHALKDWTKKQEYKYSGWQEHKTDIAKFEGKVLNKKEVAKELGQKLKGVRILSSLATFTLIYRYATPVIITPIANWIGDRINTKKAEQAKEIALNTDYDTAKAKEVSINSNNEKQSKQVA